MKVTRSNDSNRQSLKNRNVYYSCRLIRSQV